MWAAPIVVAGPFTKDSCCAIAGERSAQADAVSRKDLQRNNQLRELPEDAWHFEIVSQLSG